MRGPIFLVQTFVLNDNFKKTSLMSSFGFNETVARWTSASVHSSGTDAVKVAFEGLTIHSNAKAMSLCPGIYCRVVSWRQHVKETWQQCAIDSEKVKT